MTTFTAPQLGSADVPSMSSDTSTGEEISAQSALPTARGEEERLLDEMGGLLRKFARDLSRHDPDFEDDLWQEGALGFLEGVGEHNPTGGRSVESYAAQRARSRMIDALRQWSPLTRGEYGKVKRIGVARETCAQNGGREPTLAEVSDTVGLSPRETDRLLGLQKAERLAYLGSESAMVIDPLGEEPIDIVAKYEELGRLKEAIKGLSSQERTVVSRLLEGEEQQTIAEELSVSKETISRIFRNRVLPALRVSLAREESGDPVQVD
ncbi:sigma-70 family RNA polymerase sigma factor [bacterium]|nr:sigma-70 family RNA polymerase sigma factor [bacterium]